MHRLSKGINCTYTNIHGMHREDKVCQRYEKSNKKYLIGRGGNSKFREYTKGTPYHPIYSAVSWKKFFGSVTGTGKE